MIIHPTHFFLYRTSLIVKKKPRVEIAIVSEVCKYESLTIPVT